MTLSVLTVCVALMFSSLNMRFGEAPMRVAWRTANRVMTAQQHSSEISARPTWPPALSADPGTWGAGLRFPARWLADDLQSSLRCCGFASTADMPLSRPCPSPWNNETNDDSSFTPRQRRCCS
jgi:hypothetical protein